ncbi:MAG: thiamine pyrophosphate-dependent enzyme [Pseudomonadota bacterium]
MTSRLNRRDVVSELLEDREELLVVTGLGSPTYDVMAAGDHDRNYYLWGAMGGAALIGLGLALAMPDEKVLVITGDGEMLMALGGLATIAVKRPKNLSIVVLDNGHYGETGMQLSHSGHGVKLEKVAESVEFEWTQRISSMDEVIALRSRVHAADALNFASVVVDTGDEKRVLPSRDGVYIKNRFKTALGQEIT